MMCANRDCSTPGLPMWVSTYTFPVDQPDVDQVTVRLGMCMWCAHDFNRGLRRGEGGLVSTSADEPLAT